MTLILPKIDSASATQAFTVTSGALRVTDPCYHPSTWCSGQVENVLNGTWHARVGYFKDELDVEQGKKYIAGLRDELKEDRDRFATMVNRDKPSDLHISEAKLDLIFAAKAERIDQEEKEINECPGRVAYLEIAHESVTGDAPQLAYELVEGLDVGVDSGQAGFFDLAQYLALFEGEETDERGDPLRHSTFYKQVCELTLASSSFGVVPFGVASSSGYGDGGYELHVKRNDQGQVVAGLILFIWGEEEDEGE